MLNLYLRGQRRAVLFSSIAAPAISALILLGSQSGITAAPSISLSLPANNAVFAAPTNVPLAVSVSDASGTVTNVSFYQGGNLVAALTNSPFSTNWAVGIAGSYALTAVAFDNLGLAATSSVVNVTITNSPALQTIRQIKTLFVIALENHDFTQYIADASPQQLLGNPAAPYFNSLITPGNPNSAQVSYAAAYYNVARGEHPSEPNYIWAEAGTDFGVKSDYDPSPANSNIFTAQHLTGQMTAAGIPWKSYQEDFQYISSAMVSGVGTAPVTNIYNGSTEYGYLARHNPMEFFSDTQNTNVFPLFQLWTDLSNNAAGRYNWITPDEFNEMHSYLPSGFNYAGTLFTGDQAAIAQGDNFLSIAIPKIMASKAYQDHGAIIIWMDETVSSDDTNTSLPFILISPLAKGNAYASRVITSHCSYLKTMDEIFGLAYQTNSVPTNRLNAVGNGINTIPAVNDLSDLFQSAVPSISVQSSNGASLANNSGSINAGLVGVGYASTNFLVISNAGTASLLVSGAGLAGANPGDFSINAPGLPATLAPGAETTLQVLFSPTTNGARSATLQLTNTDPVNNPFVISLNGTGHVGVLINVPSNIVVAATNSGGNMVQYSVSAIAANGSQLTPSESPPSGSVFPIGTNNVVVTAQPSSGSAATNSFMVVVKDTTPPVFTRQPAGSTNMAGAGVSFTATATGLTPVSYQWFRGNGTALAGQTSSTLSYASVSSTNAGDYYVVATSQGGSTQSGIASLVVISQTPEILGGQMLAGAGGGFHFSITGLSGNAYRVFASDNLAAPFTNWTLLGSGTFSNYSATFTDTNSSNHPNRFYIIKSP